MPRSFPLKQFQVSSIVDDGLSPRPPPRFSVDSLPVSRATVADRHLPVPLLTANLLRPISSNFITGTRRSCNSPVSAIAALRTAVAPPSRLRSPADHHRSPRLVMAHPPIRSVSATGATPETPPPADGDSQPEMLTELTRSTPPLTGSTRSTQSTEQLQQPPSSIPMPNLPKKTFAEVVAPSRASEIAKMAPHKYFLADSPQPAIGTILTDDQGPKLLFTNAETEVLAAPFKFALVGKFSHGTPSYSMLHKLMAGTGIKNRFTVSMLNNRHVLISLSYESDYTRLWLRRIWYIQGYPMRVFKWTPTFTPSKESSIVPVWVSFPELPAHLFRKEVLFTVASMIGTPLQIDDATLNQSKLSKARACIELDLLKPRLENFQIQICGATIVQRIEYEDIPHYCSLCKHVGHRDSDCYTEGDAPKPPPRKPSNRAGKKVAEEVGRGKAVAKETGESSKMMDQPAKDPRYQTEHKTDSMASVDENIVSVDIANTTCEEGKMGDENSENKMAEGNWIQVGNATMLLQQNQDEGESLVSSAKPLKICDPICSTNRNPVDTDSAEQLLQELASPARLPRNQFRVDEIPEYLVRYTEEKTRVMKQRSGSCGPRIKTDRVKKKWKKQKT
ncbi:UNVERIFIED_CONTAM: hypothetical protein Sindi_0554700 [Sesamum indicum]